jgi:hypothetical protein
VLLSGPSYDWLATTVASADSRTVGLNPGDSLTVTCNQGGRLSGTVNRRQAVLQCDASQDSTPTPTAIPAATATPTPVPQDNNNGETFPASNPLTLGDCPASVHDKYMVVGPDGKRYRTWHPIVDPQTGCHFAHEHGDMLPAGAPLPPFGYAAEQAGMAAEIALHTGFKVYSHSPGNISGFGQPEADYRGPFDGKFYFVIHQGSGGAKRLVEQFHSTNFWSRDAQGRETNVFALADTGQLSDKCDERSSGGRSVVSHNCPVYETWQFNVNVGNAWSVNTVAAVTYPLNHMHGSPPCADATCSNVSLVSSSQEICNGNSSACGNKAPMGSADSLWLGHIRTLHEPNWQWTNAGGAAQFCTDPMGMRQACSAPHSIMQRVPAVRFDNSGASQLLRTENAAGFDAVEGPLGVKGAPGGN